MATLPTPGADNDTWGDEINEYLLVAHNTDGTLKVISRSGLNFGSGLVNADIAAAAAIAESKLSLASDAAAGTASRRTLGTGATQAAAGNDSRLSDTRTPTDSSVTNAKVSASAAIAESKLSLASDAAAGTPSRRTLGTGATQAAPGNHTHAGLSVSYFNVKDYGAVGDYDPVSNTGTNDTAAFAAAIAAAAGATVYGGVGAIFVPKGNYSVAASALNAIPNRVAIVGGGMGSTIYRRTGTNGPFIKSAALARAIMVANIRIDGNSSRVTDTTADGIVLDAPEPQSTAEFLDGRHHISNVAIMNTGRTALVQQNRGVCLVENLQIWQPGGHGIDANIDSRYVNVDIGRAGWDGIIIRSGGNTFSGCKAWFSGAVSTTGNSETGGTGHGFHFMATNYSANNLAACSAQDNGRSGFYLNNVGRQQLTGCDADSNNSLNTGHCGVEVVNSYGNQIIGMLSWDRGANAQPQVAALRSIGGAGNVIQMIPDGTMTQGRLSTDSDTTYNDVKFGSPDALNWLTYAATITPDAVAGQVIRVDLTGNITINAPTKPHAGQRLTFIFTQDATGGRTVTWNAIFKVNWTPQTTPNSVNTIEFIYNGSNWIQVRPAPDLVVANAQSAAYTLVLSDASKVIEITSASGVVLTVPTNASVAFPIGTVIEVFQVGAGAITIAGSGVTFQSRGGALITNGQYATATLRKRATNTWAVAGDVA